MTTGILLITTGYQDVSAFGQGRQVCIAGGTPDLQVEVMVKATTDDTTEFMLERLAGVNRVTSHIGEANGAISYRLLAGSLSGGSIWLQADENADTAPSATFDLGAALNPTDVSELAIGRSYYLAGAPAGFVVEIQASDNSEGLLKWTPLARLATGTTSQASVFLSTDASVIVRYVIVSGITSGTTKVWVAGGVPASGGGGGGFTPPEALSTTGATFTLSGAGRFRVNGNTGETIIQATQAGMTLASDEIAINPATSFSVGAPLVSINGTEIGFYTATPVAIQNVTGAKGGNVALGNLLTALAALGLITNGTT